jgi:imidazolonepropionase-like amidohydrolase
MVSVKSSRVLSSWPGWVSSAVSIAALTAAAHLHAQSPQPLSAPAPSATAIVNARIIDGSGNGPFEGSVVIKGDRIAEVGRSVKPPEGARVIDAQGGTVMPGVVDLIVELPRGAANDALARAAAASLYAGVTTIVPNGWSASEIDALRDRLLRAGIKSPRLAIPAAPDRLVRGGASGGSLADAQAFNEWKQNNATYVPVLAAAAPAENRKPTALWGELSGTAGSAADAMAGANGAENGGAPGTSNASGASGTLGASGASGTSGASAAAGTPADPARWKALLDQTRSARDAGIRLGLGSGGGVQGLPHGWSSLLAVRLFADAGLTPLQAVTAATSGGAWALGVQSDRGFLAVGQRADLLVVSGDPSSSINDIEKIAHVIFGGEVLDRAALRALIAGSSGAPAGTESTASLAGGKPSSSTAAGAANTSTGGVPGASAPGANAANATPGAPGADPKARGAKPTARERAAARGKRGAAPAPTSPESAAATTETPGAAPGTPASAPGTEAPSSTASSSPGSPSATPSSTTPSNATPSTATPGASPSSTAPGASASSPSNAAAANPSSSAGASPGSVSMAAAIVATNPVIDDFEGGRDASTVGGAWSSAGESGTTSTTVVMGRVVRGARDHALNVTARMGEARDAHARVTVRVAQDGRPLDVSRFHGVRFDARGQGRYRIIFISRGVTDGRYHESNFSGSPLWTPVSIPFASVGQAGKGDRQPWTGRDLVEIVFLLARDPGDFGYLELDNLRFY